MPPDGNTGAKPGASFGGSSEVTNGCTVYMNSVAITD